MEHKTTPKQESYFIDLLFDGMTNNVISALKDALGGNATWVLEWVAENFAPEEVYDVAALEKWASDVRNTEDES